MKKRFVRLLVSVVLLLCILPCSLIASAAEYKSELVSQLEESLDVSVFYEEGEDRLIKCFDANSNGWYAIGYNNNIIQVYNDLGEFQYGLSFDTEGTYGVDLLEKNIVIYLGRSYIAVEIDPSGKCVDAEEIHYLDNRLDDAFYRTSKQVGSVCYYLERDIGVFDGYYPRLVRTDEAGDKAILHDVTTWGYFVGVFHCMALIFFPVAIVSVAIKKSREGKRESEQEKAAAADNNEPQNS